MFDVLFEACFLCHILASLVKSLTHIGVIFYREILSGQLLQNKTLLYILLVSLLLFLRFQNAERCERFYSSFD